MVSRALSFPIAIGLRRSVIQLISVLHELGSLAKRIGPSLCSWQTYRSKWLPPFERRNLKKKKLCEGWRLP